MEDWMYEIKKAADDTDLRTCVDILRESFEGIADQFGLTAESAPTNAAFITIERLTRECGNGLEMFILLDEGVPAGTVGVKKTIEGDFFLEKLGVLPEYRHHGYGKSLVEFIMDKVLSEGGKKIKIGIIEDNSRLKKWYSRMGFDHTGTKSFPHLPYIVGYMERIL